MDPRLDGPLPPLPVQAPLVRQTLFLVSETVPGSPAASPAADAAVAVAAAAAGAWSWSW